MRVLLVEDEGRIADFVSRGLSEQGYAVDVATNGEDALHWVEVAPFDLIALDVMLPRLNGIDVCRTLRERGFKNPILMLTAMDAVEQRVRGLDSGADDYLVKPFAFQELLARLRALSRRPAEASGAVLTIADLRLDTSTLEVSRQGVTIPLTAKERVLLEYLIRHQDQVLTRTVIAEHVWNYDFDAATNVIDVHVRNITQEGRRPLRDEAHSDRPRSRVPDKREAGRTSVKPPSTRLRLTLWYAGLLTVILVAFGAGVYLILRQALYANLDESIEAQATAVLPSIRSDQGRPLLPGGTSTRSDDDDVFVRVSGVSDQPSTRPDPQFRVKTFPIVRDGRTVGLLEVGQSRDDVSEALRTLLLVMAFAYPVTIAVAAVGGAFLVGRALSPVDRITRLARRISAEDLGQRLDLDLPDDEIGRLARTFDQMIERLDEAFRRQGQFTADASHELRTPLTAIKGQVEVALQRDRPPADYQEVLEKVNVEVDRLIGLANSLLTLARAEAGGTPLELEAVDVHSLISGTVEQMCLMPTSLR